MIQLKRTQKSYVPSEKDLEKKWFLVDVKGKTLGDVSTQLADILRGKGKALFNPQYDCGDYVVVLNAKWIRMAGNKVDTKKYYWHSGYGGGLKTKTARQLVAEKPEKILYDSVRGMLPRNKLRKKLIRKLRIFPGTEHTHKAQSLQPLDL